MKRTTIILMIMAISTVAFGVEVDRPRIDPNTLGFIPDANQVSSFGIIGNISADVNEFVYCMFGKNTNEYLPGSKYEVQVSDEPNNFAVIANPNWEFTWTPDNNDVGRHYIQCHLYSTNPNNREADHATIIITVKPIAPVFGLIQCSKD